MLVKFFGRGKGGGASPVSYLLGANLDRIGARVISGNPFLTKELIDATDYARRYTSGVLSFEESADVLTEQQKLEVIEKFEKTLFSGLEPDQYNVLWVEHTDKERLELNFLIPNQELRSGKRLQPFYHVADKRRVNAFQDIINHDYKLTDPHDIKKKRLQNPHPSRNWTIPATPKPFSNKRLVDIDNHAELHDEINKSIKEVFDDEANYERRYRSIRSQKTVAFWLEEQGLKVERMTKQSITVSSPNPDIKKNVRLKGAMYERRFNEHFYREERKNLKLLDVSHDTQRYENAVSDWEEGIRIKEEYHAKRFTAASEPEPVPIAPETELNSLTAKTDLREVMRRRFR